MNYIFAPCTRKKRILQRSSLVAVGDDILSEILDYSSSLDLIVFQRVSKVKFTKKKKIWDESFHKAIAYAFREHVKREFPDMPLPDSDLKLKSMFLDYLRTRPMTAENFTYMSLTFGKGKTKLHEYTMSINTKK